MAISRIAGQMLNTNLQRDGVNLSFSNTSNSTPVLYIDIGNSRVGVNNSSPAYALDVTGNINANATVTGANVSTAGNVTAGNVVTNNVYNTSGALGIYTVGNGNILLTPNGTGFSKAVGTNGFVIPVGNTAQRPGSPDTGTLRFNNQTIQTEIWDGAEWVTATGTTSAIVNQTITSADGTTTTFGLTYSATAESILVTINGVMQTPTTAYTTNTGDLTITFTEAPAIADLIQVRYIASTTVLAAVINGTSNVSIPVSGGNVVLSASGSANVLNITSTGANTTGYANITGNITSGSAISAVGNISGNYILGNGALLTGVITSVANINSGTSNVTVVSSGGNVTVGVGGTANVAVFATTGEYVTGVVSATGNVTGGNILTGGLISATGNITSANYIGNVYTNSIINTGANSTGNIGSAAGYFNTVFAKATSAQYADLAEFYSADAEYAPGTVVSFGGDYEVTIANQDADPCVAGIVSTNPSYIMNAGIFAEFPTQVALTGRVPCRVVGTVTKGAMMVSAGNGAARAESMPAMGTVIGKALEAFSGESGTIEIVVGRL